MTYPRRFFETSSGARITLSFRRGLKWEDELVHGIIRADPAGNCKIIVRRDDPPDAQAVTILAGVLRHVSTTPEFGLVGPQDYEEMARWLVKISKERPYEGG